MPKGIYKRTDKNKRNLSESHKGWKPSEITRKRMSDAGKKKIFTKEHRENLSKALMKEKIGVVAMHSWVVKHKGKAKMCEDCRSTKNRRYNWSNKDHKYRRVLEDYISRCVPCHQKYDIKFNGYVRAGKK